MLYTNAYTPSGRSKIISLNQLFILKIRFLFCTIFLYLDTP
jgi:hypothetical protein